MEKRSWLSSGWLLGLGKKGSFYGDIDIDVDIDVGVDIDKYLESQKPTIIGYFGSFIGYFET